MIQTNLPLGNIAVFAGTSVTFVSEAGQRTGLFNRKGLWRNCRLKITLRRDEIEIGVDHRIGSPGCPGMPLG